MEWIPETKPSAVLQIAHGVTEYIERYEDFSSGLFRELLNGMIYTVNKRSVWEFMRRFINLFKEN